MLGKLRAEALALIATTSHCTLSTMGSAGVQASIIACIVRDECVYALVPSTADHLFNLEYHTEVVLTTALWQLRGVALVIGGTAGHHGTAPHDVSRRAKMEGQTLLEVFPLRVHFVTAASWLWEFLAFTLRYTELRLPRPHITFALLVVPLVALVVLAYTDPLHTLIRAHARLVPGQSYNALLYDLARSGR